MSPTSEQLEAAIGEAHRCAEVAARARAVLDAEGLATDRLQIARWSRCSTARPG